MASRDQPSILHVDMDAFFASVEVLENPALVGHPVIVGGSGSRGVVASCNYEARRFGVRSAMPSVVAKRLCPNAKFVEGNFGRYEHYSGLLKEVLFEFTPLVEPVSIDEAFLDVGGARRMWGSPSEIAFKIRSRVWDQLQLRASIGGATTKHLAKLASVHAKPHITNGQLSEGSGVLIIPPTESLNYLHALPVSRLWGVGPKTTERLADSGFKTVGQLATADIDALCALVGKASALHLVALANNDDDRSVELEREAKSVGHEQTFAKNLTERADVEDCFLRQADAVASRLRVQSKDARTVSIKIRYGDFRTISRSVTLAEPTSSAPDIHGAAKRLFAEIDLNGGVRLVGVSASNFVDAGLQADQLSFALKLDEESVDDARKVDEVIDDIRKRFGKSAVMPATLAGNDGSGVLRRGERQWGPSQRDYR